MGAKQQSNRTVRRGRTVVGVCLLLAFAAIFNFLPQVLGRVDLFGQPVVVSARVLPAFWRLLPWLNIWWGLAIVVNCTHLILGWKPLIMRWADVVVRLSGAGLLGWMAQQAPSLLAESVVAESRSALALGCLLALLSASKPLMDLLTPHPVIFRWDEAEPKMP